MGGSNNRYRQIIEPKGAKWIESLAPDLGVLEQDGGYAIALPSGSRQTGKRVIK